MKKLFAFLFFLISFVAKPQEEKDTIPSWKSNRVSMIQLIANPEKYDGKLISISGYLNYEFEGQSIYLHKEDSDHYLFENALWIELSDELKKHIEYYNRDYVDIEGVFDMKLTGQWGLWPAGIKNVKEIRRRKL